MITAAVVTTHFGVIMTVGICHKAHLRINDEELTRQATETMITITTKINMTLNEDALNITKDLMIRIAMRDIRRTQWATEIQDMISAMGDIRRTVERTLLVHTMNR